MEFSSIDVDTSEPIHFYILYRSEVFNQTALDYHVSSRDLAFLDLAYALTVHKLQGSQAKLCICVFLFVGGNFISRNMLYTGLTRAQIADYLLGDVYGRNSAVNRGRRIEQTELRTTNLDNIV
ncbi:ATP-dependent RecD-like DNA helicase [compost metagenome]